MRQVIGMKTGKNIRGDIAVYTASALAAVLCVMLLARGGAVRRGALEGLKSCGNIIIPSLYLFMVLSGFIARSAVGDVLARPLAPVTRYVFRLPACMGPAIVLSCIGGYPVGARTIADLLDEGSITDRQAERALCFCCNAGPSFVVTAIGSGMLGSSTAGGILLAAHLLSSLLMGALLSLRSPLPPKQHVRPVRAPLPEAFIAGVNSATSGILSICAFVVFFSAFSALLEDCGPLSGSGVLRCVLIGLLEVTTGCMEAASLPGRWPCLLIPIFISFAGLSILFQIRAILAGRSLHFGRFYLCRILHAGMTLAFSCPFLWGMDRTIDVFASQVSPVSCHTPDTPVTAVLLMLLSAAILWRATGGEK